MVSARKTNNQDPATAELNKPTPTGSDKSAYHHGDLAAALLDAADELLAQRGLQGFTLRGCARQAGVSHAAPKHHFGDTQGLLTQVATRGFQRLTACLEQQLTASKPSAAAQFLAVARGYQNFAEGFPEHFRMMFRADLLDNCDESLQQAAQSTFNVLTNFILRLRGEAEIGITALDTDNPVLPALLDDILLGWTFVHGFAHLQTERQLDMMPTTLLEDSMDRVATRLSELLTRNRGTMS